MKYIIMKFSIRMHSVWIRSFVCLAALPLVTVDLSTAQVSQECGTVAALTSLQASVQAQQRPVIPDVRIRLTTNFRIHHTL
ncbi:MAG: hypothetical protein HY707_01155 [Ignavibacteriae bacterium]|nr:hypothetical protein [Ignavibacteriota bacterium]